MRGGQQGGNHAYGMQQGFSMAHNGHPNMAQYGIGGGRHHLMNLADTNTGLSTDNLLQTPAPAPA